jgi:SAM-dependent methyltransferase
MTMPPADMHLDLGCGKFPRNPYGRAKVCGVDLRELSGDSESFEFRRANVVLEPIPYGDNEFGSVSAFDFIEHVPRLLATPDGTQTFFPFINLMSEIWRVLAPGGRFYALTPAFPNPEVFVDPTHVNVITDRTHEYFCGDNPLGKMYGFRGQFKVIRAQWVRVHESLVALPPGQAKGYPTPVEPAPLHQWIARLVRDTLRRWRGRPAPSSARLAYFLWELEAVKPEGAAP